MHVSKTETKVGHMRTTVTHKGRRFVVESYVDPHPGKAASDRVTWTESCPRCGGSGVYRWWTTFGTASGTCFGCFGRGKVDRSQAVSTLRREARLAALFREHGSQLADEAATAMEAAEAARLAAEFEAAWVEAHAEQDRRSALNNAPVGAVGERLRNLEGIVTVATGYRRPSFNGFDTDYVKILIVQLPTGQVLKMQGQAECLYGPDRGDRVRVTGTVKEFDTYKGQLQTVLSRPALAAA